MVTHIDGSESDDCFRWTCGRCILKTLIEGKLVFFGMGLDFMARVVTSHSLYIAVWNTSAITTLPFDVGRFGYRPMFLLRELFPGVTTTGTNGRWPF